MDGIAEGERQHPRQDECGARVGKSATAEPEDAAEDERGDDVDDGHQNDGVDHRAEASLQAKSEESRQHGSDGRVDDDDYQ